MRPTVAKDVGERNYFSVGKSRHALEDGSPNFDLQHGDTTTKEYTNEELRAFHKELEPHRITKTVAGRSSACAERPPAGA